MMELLGGGAVLTIIVNEEYQDEIYCVLSKPGSENQVIGRASVVPLVKSLYSVRKVLTPVILYKDKNDEFEETIIVHMGSVSVAIKNLVLANLHRNYSGIKFKAEE